MNATRTEDNYCCVAALDAAGNVVTNTLCDKENAKKYASYYHSLKEKGFKKYPHVKTFYNHDEFCEYLNNCTCDRGYIGTGERSA